jgi:hypothetical protein
LTPSARSADVSSCTFDDGCRNESQNVERAATSPTYMISVRRAEMHGVGHGTRNSSVPVARRHAAMCRQPILEHNLRRASMPLLPSKCVNNAPEHVAQTCALKEVWHWSALVACKPYTTQTFADCTTAPGGQM